MEEQQKGIVLFGGSFDPVQTSHIELINKLSERFAKVIVVPSLVSPFKKGARAVDGKFRLKMLEASLQKTENVEICTFELENEGAISYTFDTVMHIREKDQTTPFYIAIGTDMLATLHKWHRMDEIKSLVTFYVIGRAGFMVKDTVVRKLMKLGIQLKFADFTGGSASSSQAKLDCAFDIFDSVPKAAASIIQAENLYADYRVIVDAYPAFALSVERVKHTYRTAVMAINLAKIHKAPVRDAVVAALLHDIAKCATQQQLEAMQVVLPQESFDAPAKVRHAFWGAAVAKTVFGIKKKTILDAIYYHTTGAPRMGKLAKIIYLADLCEDGRDEYDNLSEIRALSAVKLNTALLLALKGTIARLQKSGKPIHSLTKEACEFYQNASVRGKTANRTESLQSAVSSMAMKQNAAEKPITKSMRNTTAIPNTESEDGTELAHRIAELLDEKKARDITLINLVGKTIVADYFVIATVGSTTAVRALTDYVDEKLSKEQGIEPLRRDLDTKWTAVDYGSVILHIQTDEVRKFYDLERLWNDGTNTERYHSS